MFVANHTFPLGVFVFDFQHLIVNNYMQHKNIVICKIKKYFKLYYFKQYFTDLCIYVFFNDIKVIK